MYYSSYESNFRAPINESYFRFLHASPGTAPVDVYINGKLLVPNLRYQYFTNYFKRSGGYYEVTVYTAGKNTNPLISTRINISPNSIYTLAVIGTDDKISLMPIMEPLPTKAQSHAMIRLVHLSPNAPAVDLTSPDGKKLFKNVEYKEVTGYIPLVPSTYTFQLRAAGTDKVVLIVPNIKLAPGKIYTVYAVGLLGGRPPLQVLIPLDGSTYLEPHYK
ncbi:DUF4397 domain-containing protein [Clostridium sp. 19966]|uniref:DUF4397 domain-containing protein n=1 Tax=Clostridium sp. 19966 TaxID=2768166 RepID=UPI0028DFBD59|nr:DUF4397 domain-containing protein [Clostridium sp. 19966]MDT8719113.1 DUF4397 domain-containing protein [Clostridium sp. 19966]